MVTEYGSDHEVLLCDVDANPQRIVDGLKAKRLKLRLGPRARRTSDIGRYDRIGIIDNGPAADPTT
jgi:hypothetical protein